MVVTIDFTEAFVALEAMNEDAGEMVRDLLEKDFTFNETCVGHSAWVTLALESYDETKIQAGKEHIQKMLNTVYTRLSRKRR